MQATWTGIEDTMEYQTEKPDVGFVFCLQCAETGCDTPLAVISPRKSAMSPAEIEADVATWEWDELLCPKGHRIPKPERAKGQL